MIEYNILIPNLPQKYNFSAIWKILYRSFVGSLTKIREEEINEAIFFLIFVADNVKTHSTFYNKDIR